jgi:hypothetical protein
VSLRHEHTDIDTRPPQHGSEQSSDTTGTHHANLHGILPEIRSVVFKHSDCSRREPAVGLARERRSLHPAPSSTDKL